jgi:hypothetical protein
VFHVANTVSRGACDGFGGRCCTAPGNVLDAATGKVTQSAKKAIDDWNRKMIDCYVLQIPNLGDDAVDEEEGIVSTYKQLKHACKQRGDQCYICSDRTTTFKDGKPVYGSNGRGFRSFSGHFCAPKGPDRTAKFKYVAFLYLSTYQALHISCISLNPIIIVN